MLANIVFPCEDKLRVKPPKMTSGNKMLYFSLQAQSPGCRGLGV